MVANSFGYAGFIAIAAVTTLLASDISGGASLAGIPAAAGTLGTAIAAAPLAQRSKRRGRRRGLSFGYLVGVAGCVAAFYAGQIGAFGLLVVAMAIVGIGNTSNLQNRFTAADLADDDKRARSIAMVVWVGTVGAVIGPPAALWANRVGMDLGLVEWVAPMLLGAIGFTLAGTVITVFLRPDPLELAGGVDPSARVENPVRGARDAWRVIWPNKGARLAIVAMAVSQMAMVAVMVMTPLHMKDFGHAELSTLVIAVHVLGMFGLAPLIGRWADRFGRVRAIQSGALVLGSGTVVAVVVGYVPALIFAGLFLLGAGWSLALIGGSALLTESLPEAERVPAQGFADVLMSLLGAVAAFSSGFVKEVVGYHWLANFATVAAVLILVGAVRVNARLAEASA
jgi:MFS family permease